MIQAYTIPEPQLKMEDLSEIKGITKFEALAKEMDKLKKENEMLALNIEELTKTNEFLVSATWREREMKQKLHEALEELKETKQLVDIQHKNITDSINYASRIQDAIIPKHHELKEKFKDIFIYHQSKDIVSGDFPWYFEIKDHLYLAAVDCTGHGVPGAMMSLIGHLLLNDITKHEAIDPATILSHLHQGVVKTLKQDAEGKQTADGMDVALCRINVAESEIVFAGAHRPLYHISNGDLKIYPGDKFPIGGNQYKGKNTYSNYKLRLGHGDSVYFFSDGLTDQFGGPNGLKIGPRRIREILIENAQLGMNEQHEKMKSSFDEWKGQNKQIDDLLLIGIKF